MPVIETIAERSEPLVSRALMERMLYGSAGRRRFTQNSPVMPEVWIAYAADPRKPIDCLITPNRGKPAGEVAATLLKTVKAYRERCRKSGRVDPLGRDWERQNLGIAYLPGTVAARLYLDEVVDLLLPMTGWWKERCNVPPGEARSVLAECLQLARDRASGKDVQKAQPQHLMDAAWLVRIVGLIAAGMTDVDFKVSASFPDEVDDAQDARLLDAFLNLIGGKPESPSEEEMIFRVTLNRRAERAISASTLAMKADAGRLLFNVSCKSITWAVIDSGIDPHHPAFLDWSKTVDGKPPTKSRIDHCYDFTRLREVLDLDDQGGAVDNRLLKEISCRDPAMPQDKQLDCARELGRRIKLGMDVSWDLLAPLVRDRTKQTPAEGHGTHVAGILGADWREAVPGGRGKKTVWAPRMQGVCPDIRLIDMRVFRPDGDADEFEVIAALQLVRHLNARADYVQVHGVNLSLSIRHDVANYACGRTPVCEECNQLAGAGVVVVAAAGNYGHFRHTIENQPHEGYNSISITDPGNAENAITVGATHREKPHEYGVSYFSSRGPTGDGRRKPDLVAPGEKIVAPLPYEDEGPKDGTSMAAPHVSGAAAMLMARYSELVGEPVRIKEILCKTATDLRREPYFQGAGMLDVLRALQSI